MIDFISEVLTISISFTIPILLTSLGELVSQSSGVLNLSLEGIMLMSAFFAVWGTSLTANNYLGLLIGTLVGGLMGLIHAVLTVVMKANQTVSGLALWIFGMGVSGYLFRATMGLEMAQFVILKTLEKVPVPVLSNIPVIGPSIFNQSIIVYIAFALVPIIRFILKKTTIGLNIRTVGENPLVGDSLGLNVNRIRFLCVLFGGLMAGLGGSFLSTGITGFFGEGMTVGMGFIAYGLVFFGNWNAYRIFVGSVIFGFVYSLQMRLQALFEGVPYPLFLMLPYIIIILVFILSPGMGRPAALGTPYEKQ